MTTATQDVGTIEQAQVFMSRDEHCLFVDGLTAPAASVATLTTVNPSTGQALARLAAGDKGNVDRAGSLVGRAFATKSVDTRL